jgi:methylated-DNA-[protein]-cysteine S-methyltransferase
MRIETATLETPVGEIAIGVHDGRVCALQFADKRMKAYETIGRLFGEVEFVPLRGHPTLDALRAYFDGDIAAIDGIDVEMHGTPFQRSVWAALRTIPAGETASYRDIAIRIGSPQAVRAVGAANGANPVGVIVPCHRVIRADGSLCGYGGGIERKKWLLEHERRHAAPARGAQLELAAV